MNLVKHHFPTVVAKFKASQGYDDEQVDRVCRLLPLVFPIQYSEESPQSVMRKLIQTSEMSTVRFANGINDE